MLKKVKGAGRGRSPGKGQGKGNGSRGDSPQPEDRFIWHGNCWCCNAPGHKSDECDKYKNILGDNNGKKTAGDIGAYEKAKNAWRKTKKKEREARKDHLI